MKSHKIIIVTVCIFLLNNLTSCGKHKDLYKNSNNPHDNNTKKQTGKTKSKA